MSATIRTTHHLLVATPDPIGLLEDWPELARRLAVADHHREDFLAVEDWLLAAHQVPAETEPALAADALGLTGSGHGWLRVEALSLVVSRDRLLALPQQAADAADAAVLIDGLLPQLPVAGRLHAAGTQRLLDLDAPADARFAPAWRTAGRPLDEHLPQGPRGGFWRRWLTEAQMLLHEHPRNAEREARGLRPLNALWLSGGAATAPATRDCGVRVCGHNAVAAALPVLSRADAGEAGGRQAKATPSEDTDPPGLTIVWLHQPGHPPPVAATRALSRGKLELRILEPSGQQCYTRRRWQLLRVWRRPLSMLGASHP
jgi:hypothetical protein